MRCIFFISAAVLFGHIVKARNIAQSIAIRDRAVSEVIRHPNKKTRLVAVLNTLSSMPSRVAFFDWVPDDFRNSSPVLQWVTQYYMLSLYVTCMRHQEIA